MASILGKLQEIARKARGHAHVPQVVRTVLGRFDNRLPATPAATPAPVPPPVVEPEPVVAKQVNWELRTQAEIVDHIIAHYHEGLRRDLPALIDAAGRIERAHADHPAVPKHLSDELDAFASELLGHMLKEEHVLFPMLRTGARGGQLDMPMRMMERDHDSHSDALERIRASTGDLTPPADASASWIELYTKLATLERELREHIYLENNILFARAAGDTDR